MEPKHSSPGISFAACPWNKLNDLGVICDKAGKKRAALSFFKQALLKNPDSFIPYFNIANLLSSIGEHGRAIYFYEKAFSLAPQEIDILISLAHLYHRHSRRDQAIALYQRILELAPEHEMARHLLNSLTGNSVSQPPLGYIERLFDDYAIHFDEHLNLTLSYASPSLVYQFATEIVDEPLKFGRGLDLGCGTGLSGSYWQQHIDEFVGVDISAKMLQEAEQKHIYHKLVHTGILDYLAAAEPFDLILAVDVLPYMGELSEFFVRVAAKLTASGLLLITTEHDEDGKAYHITSTGRYLHSHSYIQETAVQAGLMLKGSKIVTIRKQSYQDVKGELLALVPATRLLPIIPRTT
jgi:predicted TPR repeat methyltransferase